MEQRSPTNTGFTPGALVERRPEYVTESLGIRIYDKLFDYDLYFTTDPRKTARWFADTAGLLHLRQRRGRLSKLEQANSTSFSIGAQVHHKGSGRTGKISRKSKRGKKWRVKWDDGLKPTQTMSRTEDLEVPEEAWFAADSWLVEWEDGSQARLKQDQLLPVWHLHPTSLPTYMGVNCTHASRACTHGPSNLCLPPSLSCQRTLVLLATNS